MCLLLLHYHYHYFINLAFCTGRSYTNSLPIKQVITIDQRFMGLLSISLISKTCTFLYFYILLFLTCLVFGTISLSLLSPPHLPICHFFIKSLQPCYPQSKTFLNIKAVPSKAVFCSNAVLITSPSFSMHFFSFFDVLPSAPSTTGMTLILPHYVPHSFDFFL